MIQNSTSLCNKSHLSNIISWLRFPLIFFIIMLHCYSVTRLEGNHESYFKILYPFSLWIGETGVPGFFFISGLLFFLSSKTYNQKIKTRLNTLLVPYFLWNGAMLLVYFIAFLVGFPQEINHHNIANYTLFDYLRLFWDRGSYDNGNFVPLLCPLWYIRNLFLMALISPLLYFIIRYTRELFLITIAVWWFATFHNAFVPQTILFFSLGAYFSIFAINPMKFFSKYKNLLLILFVIFGLGDIIVHTIMENDYNLQIHRISLMLNIPVLFLLASFFVRKNLTSQTLSNASFVVFCIHYPIVIIMRKFCVTFFLDASDSIHILLYFASVILSTIMSLSFYQILKKFFPKTSRILSGNR